MPLIVLDGPEKAGKTTIAQAIVAKHGGRIRHWGKIEPDDRVYADDLMDDCQRVMLHNETIVWDRSWAAEHVYGKMLNRDRRLSHDAWLGEWLHGRAVQTVGVRCMVIGPSVDVLRRLRTDDDLPVDPREERDRFFMYGRYFNWLIVSNHYPGGSVERMAEHIWSVAADNHAIAGGTPPRYCGMNKAPVVFIGDQSGERGHYPGGWLPLTQSPGIEFGRMVPYSLQAGYAYTGAVLPQSLRHAQTLVALGERAARWAKHHVAGPNQKIIRIAHPAFAFRYQTRGANKARAKILQALAQLSPRAQEATTTPPML